MLKGMQDLHHLVMKPFLAQRWAPTSCHTCEAHAWFRNVGLKV